MVTTIRYVGIDDSTRRKVSQATSIIQMRILGTTMAEWDGQACDVLVAESRNQSATDAIRDAHGRGIPVVAIGTSHAPDDGIIPLGLTPSVQDVTQAIDNVLHSRNQDHTAFSPDALRILTRLSQQLRKLDGYRTSLSNKNHVFWLINQGATDPRPAVHTIVEELFQSLKAEEKAYLESHGVDLGEYASPKRGGQRKSATNRVRRVYRGQVLYEEPRESSAASATTEATDDTPNRSRRVYRGQVID